MRHTHRSVSKVLPVLPALAVLAAFGAYEGQAHAAVFVVNGFGDLPDLVPGDGVCLTAANVCSLRAAVMESNALAGADTVTIPAGAGTISLSTLGPLENAAATGDLDIADTLTIVGNGVVLDGLNDDRIFHVLNGITADISGVTILNGWGDLVGGGIYNQGDLTLGDCVITDNAAIDHGGGIKNITPGSLTMQGCVVSHNSADWGGGIYSNTAMVIEDSNIVLNDAELHGGGVYATGLATTDVVNTYFGENVAGERGGGLATTTPATLSHTKFQLNVAGTFGGGLYMYTEDAVVDAFESDFDENSADQGGGIHNFWGDLTLRRSDLRANSATTSGGGIDNQGTLVARRGVIHGNTAGINGAGIYNYWVNADLTLQNMTISGNVAAGSGSGIWVGSSSVADLTNVTVAANAGTGGLFVSGTATLVNTLVASNVTPAAVPSDCVGGVTSTGHNLIEDIAACVIGGAAVGDIYGVAPGIGVLANNGGGTLTHALAAASPAVNAGDNATCRPIDQRGVARPVGGTCDIGAFERN